MQFIKFLTINLFLTSGMQVLGQGTFSGDLLLNSSYYHRDSARNAFGTPHYNNLFYSADAWLTLNYAVSGFNFRVRYDVFNNSALHNPNQAYSAQGIGFWQASKEINNLTITGGYFYDQFGTGIVFRAYEDKGLGIDNAIQGIHLKYELKEKITIKGFTGRQKNLFEVFPAVIKGINAELNHAFNDSLRVIPGVALVNRTLEQGTMNLIKGEIEARPVEERFTPAYNAYAYSLYNTLFFRNFTWYVETALKNKETIRDISNNLVLTDGSVIYSNISYSTKGFGLTLQGKRTENFTLKTSPYEAPLRGSINFLPPLTKQTSYRLLSRYNAATQELGELAFQGDIVFTPVKGKTITVNYSDVQNLEEVQLYREAFAELKWKYSKKAELTSGFQFVQYNQEINENKPGVPMVFSYTPFLETVYKFTRKKSLRNELQFQYTEQDYGSWLYGLAEFNIAPHFSFSVSDMYNIIPKKTDDLHYYTTSTSYTSGGNKFVLSYVKQVEGIVCTGGICRYEPAFSGIKFSVNSSF